MFERQMFSGTLKCSFREREREGEEGEEEEKEQ